MRDLVQAGLVVFSMAAVILLTGKRHQRWGHVAGLCSQPFWIVSALDAGTWGVTVMAVAYTVLWCRGIYNNFDWRGATCRGK